MSTLGLTFLAGALAGAVAFLVGVIVGFVIGEEEREIRAGAR